MRTIRFQGQEAGTPTCMSACVAMLLGLPYSVVVGEFHAKYFSDEVWKGGNVTAHRYLNEYLEAYGIKSQKQECWDRDNGFIWKDGYYLLSVKSLNDPGSLHAIVIEIVERDEFTKAVFVYDPQRDNPKAFHYSSVAEEAWMHNNNKEKQLKLDCRSVEAYITRDSFNSGAVIQGY